MNRVLKGGIALLGAVALIAVSLGGTAVAQKNEVSLKDVPDFRTTAYRVDPYIRAAARLQALGKDKAGDALLQLAKNGEDDNKVIVLCRMLFTRKAKGEFRRPLIGAAAFLGGTDYADWPLEPIELIDGVPFLITTGYALRGRAEPASSYVKYCLRNCDWSSERFRPKTQKEKQNALARLLASPKWGTPLGDQDKAFLASQIK
jgi:hypothetical protein